MFFDMLKMQVNLLRTEVNEVDAVRYHYFIDQAIESLEQHFYKEAEQHIIHAITIDYSSPQGHNLLGALLELRGEFGLAGKHYLAANALDPTYIPAVRNLRRLTTYSFRKKPINPDLGKSNSPMERE